MTKLSLETGITDWTALLPLAPLGTWWPDLHFCLRQINPSVRSTPPNIARAYGFYSCPGQGKNKRCGGGNDFFCKSWGYVTSNDGD